MPVVDEVFQTYIPLPAEPGINKNRENAALLSPAPICVVKDTSQLPIELLHPCPERQMLIVFDCEGVNHGQYRMICILQLALLDAIYIVDVIQGGEELMKAFFGIKLHNVVDTQVAYSLIEEQEKRKASVDCISFVGLLADCRYCGISYREKDKFREHLKQRFIWTLLDKNPLFWTKRPFTEHMVRAAIDDVRFLPYVCQKMMEKLSEESLWRLAVVHGALYCRCFLVGNREHGYWPPIPALPGELSQGRNVPEDEILSTIDISPWEIGLVIGRKGASIRTIKEACNAEIIIHGNKGILDKVIIMGPTSEVRSHGEGKIAGYKLECSLTTGSYH